jgi:DNA-binding response OmpR family regulator
MSRILLVEDDPHLALGLEFNLRAEGYEVKTCPDAESAIEALTKESEFDLIVLDWMLPGLDGIDLLHKLRKENNLIPVLLLTARDSKEDMVEGLDSGADDYLAKPFDLNILLARIRSLLRSRSWRAAGEAPDEARFDAIRVDFNSLTAEVRGQTTKLTYKEAQILKLLWERRNDIVTREELLQKIWGVEGYIQSRTVDNHIVQLRKLLEVDPKKPKYILSIHGTGYKFIAP